MKKIENFDKEVLISMPWPKYDENSNKNQSAEMQKPKTIEELVSSCFLELENKLEFKNWRHEWYKQVIFKQFQESERKRLAEISKEKTTSDNESVSIYNNEDVEWDALEQEELEKEEEERQLDNLKKDSYSFLKKCTNFNGKQWLDYIDNDVRDIFEKYHSESDFVEKRSYLVGTILLNKSFNQEFLERILGLSNKNISSDQQELIDFFNKKIFLNYENYSQDSFKLKSTYSKKITQLKIDHDQKFSKFGYDFFCIELPDNLFSRRYNIYQKVKNIYFTFLSNNTISYFIEITTNTRYKTIENNEYAPDINGDFLNLINNYSFINRKEIAKLFKNTMNIFFLKQSEWKIKESKTIQLFNFYFKNEGSKNIFAKDEFVVLLKDMTQILDINLNEFPNLKKMMIETNKLEKDQIIFDDQIDFYFNNDQKFINNKLLNFNFCEQYVGHENQISYDEIPKRDIKNFFEKYYTDNVEILTLKLLSKKIGRDNSDILYKSKLELIADVDSNKIENTRLMLYKCTTSQSSVYFSLHAEYINFVHYHLSDLELYNYESILTYFHYEAQLNYLKNVFNISTEIISNRLLNLESIYLNKYEELFDVVEIEMISLHLNNLIDTLFDHDKSFNKNLIKNKLFDDYKNFIVQKKYEIFNNWFFKLNKVGHIFQQQQDKTSGDKESRRRFITVTIVSGVLGFTAWLGTILAVFKIEDSSVSADVRVWLALSITILGFIALIVLLAFHKIGPFKKRFNYKSRNKNAKK